MNKFCFLLLAVFFLSYSGTAQNTLWIKTQGGPSEDRADQTAFGRSGSLYATGYFNGTADFDSGPGTYTLSTLASHEVFIERLDSSGNLIWAKSLNSIAGFGYNEGNSIAVDTSENIYVTGYFMGTVDFDPGPGTYTMSSTGYYDSFIEKIDSAGNFIWAKSIGSSSGYESGTGICLDDSGNVYSIGACEGSIDLDPNAGQYFLSGYTYVQKLSPGGNFVWAKTWGYECTGKYITADQASGVYIAGIYKGMMDFDPDAGTYYLTSYGNGTYYNPFIEKLNTSNGSISWANTIDGPGTNDLNAIVADRLGGVIVTGQFADSLDFDPGPTKFELHAAGNYDAFIEKFDAVNGNKVWAVRDGGVSTDYGQSVAVDTLGNVYITGLVDGPADYDPGPGVYTVNGLGAFIQKLDASGHLVWVRNITGQIMNINVSTDRLGNVAASGGFWSTADLDPGPAIQNFSATNPGSGTKDIFIIKMIQDICSNMALVVDSVSNVTCTNQGYTALHSTGGLSQYTYTWTTSPAVNTPTVSFTMPGMYGITTTDGNSCTRTTTLLINGPTLQTGFDLDADMVNSTFRNGFSSYIWLDAFNNGCMPASGSLRLVMDTVLLYNGATPPPDQISGDTLSWNFSGINYSSAHLTPTISVTTSSLTPQNYYASVQTIATPVAGDADTVNNRKNYLVYVHNAYDPNEKSVYPSGECTPHYVLKNQKLTYAIRFQNTGNSDAINIHVSDSLSPALNLNSLRVLNSSHPLYTEILNGHVVKFNFNNIHLASSAINESLSHGHVIFEISPDTNSGNNTVVNNKANIYFDYNAPVVTNTTSNTLVSSMPQANVTISQSGGVLTSSIAGSSYQWIDCTNGAPVSGATSQTLSAVSGGNYAVVVNYLGCMDPSPCYEAVVSTGLSELSVDNGIQVFPNPTNGIFTVQQSLVSDIINVNIYDYTGRMIQSVRKENTDRANIDLKGPEGIYFVKVKSGEDEKTFKIIRE